MKVEFSDLRFRHIVKSNIIFHFPLIRLITGDVTQQNTEAIVNSANINLEVGGGVDYAIHKAAGPLLLESYIDKGGCKLGKAIITDGYLLPSKYVIHTIVPTFSEVCSDFKNASKTLMECYINIFEVARENKIYKIAIPSIATGISGSPVYQAAIIAHDTLKSYVEAQVYRYGTTARPYIFDEITFVLHSDIDFREYLKAAIEVWIPSSSEANI